MRRIARVSCSAGLVARALAAAGVLGAGVLGAGCRFEAPAGEPSDATGGPSDAMVDGAPASDGPGESPRDCLPRWRAGTVMLGAPVKLDALDSPVTDRDPSISRDELTIYFSSDREQSGSGDVFVATRLSTSLSFGLPAKRLDLSSSTAYDSRFTTTADGLIGILSSDRAPTEGGTDFWMATRASTLLPFGAFSKTDLQNPNSSGYDLDPELSADGLHLYFSGRNPQRIMVSTRSSTTGAFNSPQDVSLGASQADADPSISIDETILVFTSVRGTSATTDLYYATRTGKTGPFGPPKLVPTVNSTSDDGDPALSADGCHLYFTSDRNGDWEIFVAPVMP